MNLIAANGDMVLSADSKGSQLKKRFISAVFLTPLVTIVLIFGFPWFDILVVFSVVVMGFEWGRMAFREFRILVFLCMVCLGGGVGAIAIANSFYSTLCALIAFVLMVGGLFVSIPRQAAINLCALCVIGTTGVALIWLRSLTAMGFEIVLWLLVTVWVTDTGAYIFGKLFGVRRMAPNVSPGKTWVGLVAGAFLASLWGFFFSIYFLIGTPVLMLITSGVLAFISQAGDLTVSMAKRFYKVKDTGHLIPGHGGILDRTDGLIWTSPLVALVISLSGGKIPSWL